MATLTKILQKAFHGYPTVLQKRMSKETLE